MVRTRVGYAGGTTENPTYRNIGDHAETLQMDYDPQKTSYSDLLSLFWSAHDPSSPPISRQYMSAIFYHDAEQRRLAEESKEERKATPGTDIYTEILPVGTFAMAEDYHQKYRLRLVPSFFEELNAIYPRTEDLVASTAAARINGYVAGHGTEAQLDQEIDLLGLSQSSREKLRQMVKGRR